MATTATPPRALPAAPLSGVDEAVWLDVIQKMDEVYTRLIEEEVALEQKNAELERANAELRAAHEALKRTQQQLLHAEKMASLGQLVAGVAHELNNPISFVLGNTHALQKYCTRLASYLEAVHGGATPEALAPLRQRLRIDHVLGDLPSLIDGTLEGAQRTADIVHDLKRFSAVDPQERSPVELAEVIERAIHWVQKGRPQAVQVTWQRPSQPCIVLGSAGQLQQVLMNLLQNAYDAVAQAHLPRIDVALLPAPNRVDVRVHDNGSGIAPEHLLRIFDPFFSTKPVGQGTGLGLSISYGIAEQHGGRLSGGNAAGGGAEFLLSLPWPPS